MNKQVPQNLPRVLSSTAGPEEALGISKAVAAVVNQKHQHGQDPHATKAAISSGEALLTPGIWFRKQGSPLFSILYRGFSSAFYSNLSFHYDSDVCASRVVGELGDKFCAVFKNHFSLALTPWPWIKLVDSLFSLEVHFSS